MKNPKVKGSTFEREVCKQLSNWISAGDKDDVFWRAAMSGGRSTVAFKKGKNLANQVGDISCIDPMGHKFINAFAIECKHYSSLDFHGILTGKGKLLTFWNEINTQAKRYEKRPFLIAKQNHMPAVVCLDGEGMYKFPMFETQTLVISRKFNLYIFDMKFFCDKCPPFI